MTTADTVSLGTELNLWDAQARKLSDRFRPLRYDHQGHGDSPGAYEIGYLGRDALALLGQLSVERFSFVGLSIGGMVGMRVASETPERVERLVLCCTSDQTRSTGAMGGARPNGTGGRRKCHLLCNPRTLVHPCVPFKTPEVIEWAERMLLGTLAECYASCYEAIRDMDLRDRLGSICAATLVVSGADDPATPPKYGELILDSIPDAQLVNCPRTRLPANVGQPEEITRMVLGHLDPLTARREDL